MLFALNVFLALCATAATPAPVSPVPAVTDHHVHILGSDLLRDWKALGATFSRPDSVYELAASVLKTRAADSLCVDTVVLLPMAHYYGNAEMREGLGLSEEEEWKRVQSENDHVAREAARYPGRAVAFCSVDILRPYAWDEIRRCRDRYHSPGIKIHLASAGLDITDDAQLAVVERVTAYARREGIALVMHFDPQQRGLEASDVRHFIDRVLAPHPDLEIIIAHLGGSGGYGAWTHTVLGVFTEWLEGEARDGRPRGGVRFDLSAVILERESEGVPASTDTECRAMARDVRRLGLDRLLFGSDFPVFDPCETLRLLKQRAGLSDEEIARILRNRMHVFEETGEGRN